MSEDDEVRPRLSAVPGLASLPKPPPRSPSAAAAAPMPLPPKAPIRKDSSPPVNENASVKPSRGAAIGAEIRPSSLSLPLDLRDYIRNKILTNPDTTVAEVILGAIETNIDRLTDLVELEKPPPADRAGSGLFPHAAKAPRPLPIARVNVSVRLAAGNLDVIDRLVKEHCADNRSQLVSAALRAAADSQGG
jgi:hypothetical protein